VLAWLELWQQTEWPELQVYFTSVTDHWTTATVTGPNARKVIAKVCSDIDLSSDAFSFMDWRDGTVAGVRARIFRISFTGELSYEVNVPAHYGRHIWEALIAAGEEFNITPYGTETMHILRAEKGFIIVGQDTDGSMTPADMNMDWVVGKNKTFSFIGRRSLQRSDTLRSNRKQLVGLKPLNIKEVLPEGAQVV
jgi:sarcosine oxidase subunit alpha